ncbi:hypothetical protein KDW_38980 [Dictyobacter vulcani]|uniref:TIR domain-containing protein n=1 Tax=Dictyobacter vulcani TaxID=2607529 RepID=A0A5J4KX05_9CHLR|nr:toll/interleukin-1 receptor domain-containing protein [Dictyobacter vulcani]GER89736.1 hypothetical protein KDW_38980 [Dictyobacter vulcani]
MADQEHVELLKKGVQSWNAWRKMHPSIVPYLSYAELNGINLSGADLNGADLREAKLNGSNLSEANLTTADLSYAELSEADLSRAKINNAVLYNAELDEVHFNNANLSSADLCNAFLKDADLTDARLSYTNLSGANLRGANLSGADLSDANLNGAELSGANLRDVNFRDANLEDASLKDADLRGAQFRRTYLVDAYLGGADFSYATISETDFGDRDMREIKGLEIAKHDGPSPLSINSVYLSGGDIPEAFLRGTGAPDTFIEYMRSLVAKPIEYYTCFISYSSKDEEFAQRLYADLQARGVRCWFAPENLRGGDWFADQIERSIRVYDRLILILSEHSVESTWVEHEVRAAMEKEERFRCENHIKKAVLFPIKLDKAIEDAPAQWAATIRRERHMLNFTQWKEHQAYMKSFERLMRDIKREGMLVED